MAQSFKLSKRNEPRTISDVSRARFKTPHCPNYMLEHVDVGFPMGTSALEFSIRGIPSVLTSAGLPQDDLKQVRAYRWLFDSEGFDITAEEVSMAPSLRTFEEIIADVRNPNLAKRYGRACNAYTLANHSLASVGRAARKATCFV